MILYMWNLYKKIAQYYCLDVVNLIRRVKFFLMKSESLPSVHEEQSFVAHTDDIALTDEQAVAYDFLRQKLGQHVFCPTLIHGVTGSGKSEIYKKLIADCREKNSTVIMLLPEVGLSMQFERLFKKSFQDKIEIFSFHSGTSVAEKRALWRALLEGRPVLIIGVHLPLLLPIVNLGLIIVDEEHESGYQEKKHPKLNSKEIALMRAMVQKIPIVLGSATPSVTSMYNVEHRNWAYFKLEKRFAGEFPLVRTIRLLDKQKRDSFWISKELKTALQDRLTKKEQAIIFINRRGFSFFVQCKDCGYVFQCIHCSISLTLHEDDSLHCHYCGYEIAIPEMCAACPGLKKDFLKKGIGTQQAVTILQKMFPQARIERADLDVSKNKKQLKETLKKFEEGELDVIVGTQTIAKGYHFPNVTLVGILWADINLNFPVYNASETALQQLIQVAGRAGRQKKSSEVIIQVMSDNRINNFLHEADYAAFVQDELSYRKMFNYPPYCRLAEIELKNSYEPAIVQDCKKVAEILYALAPLYDVEILGPADPAVYKLKNYFRKTFFLKGKRVDDLARIYKKLAEYSIESDIFFTPNPQN